MSEMRTALSVPDAALDDQERNFVASVREHGWFCTSVFAEADEPQFSYSTGFWVTLGLPELIIFGLQSEVAHAILWDAFRDLKAGKTLPVRTRLDGVFGNHQAFVFLMSKTHYPEHLGWSRWFYAGDEFPCLQLVWPDRNGVFPWESGFDAEAVGSQPDVSEGGWSELQA